MSFDAYAVATRWGPHVTLQAGVVHLGRHWTTTTRRSVKVAAVARTSWASFSRTEGHRTRITGGRARVLDPSHPRSVLGEPLDAALAGGAMVRIGVGQLDQVIGYAEAGRGVPPDFLPWGRVLLVTGVDDEIVLHGDRVVSATGRWAHGRSATGPRTAIAPARRPLPAAVPAAVAALAAEDRSCWVGVRATGGTVAVPGHWDAGAGTAGVGAGVLAALGVAMPGPVCVTLDDSSSRRPDRKLGCMLRGDATVADADGTSLRLSLDVARVTWWDGFGSGSAVTR